MKITIYELLGLIKDGKAPKKINFCGNIYEWEDDWYLTKEKNCKVCLGSKKEDRNILITAFNDDVEILDEAKEDKIQKIYHCETSLIKNEVEIFITENLNQMVDKINELIDAVNELKRDK